MSGSVAGCSPYCMPCEHYIHWIDVIFVDEYNKTFGNISGVLTDRSLKKHPFTLNDGRLVINTLAPGQVNVIFDNAAWLKQTQERQANPDTTESHELIDSRLSVPSEKGNLPRLRWNATVGDLVELTEKQTLPLRHQKGQGLQETIVDKVRLQTDKHYVVCVRGTRYATLRVGLFFDGTANNSYSAKWGLNKLKGYKNTWRGYYDVAEKYKKQEKLTVQALPDTCFTFPNAITTNSAANEYTNVQKLFERYPPLDKSNFDTNTFYHGEYITGVGTGNSTGDAQADESVFGAGLGVGDYGVEAKAITAIQQLCKNLDVINTAMIDMDGINKMEFDVFGFSRGAAAARQFINLVLDGTEGEFAKSFSDACKKEGLLFSPTFDWQDKAHCEVTFAGLFDTVASIIDVTTGDLSIDNQKTGNARLWLDPKGVTHAVHITADVTTEYRVNFSLNHLNTGEGNFNEISVPGAHCDIGGGYFSSLLFDNSKYLLPMLEKKCIKTSIIDFKSRSDKERTEVNVKQALSEAQNEQEAIGWGASCFTTELNTQKGAKSFITTGKLFCQRKVNGELSRLYLRLMYGLAYSKGVPFDDEQGSVWTDIEEKQYIVPEKINGFAFVDYCAKILAEAKEGKMETIQKNIKENNFKAALMNFGLIHHSADEGFVNSPQHDKKRNTLSM